MSFIVIASSCASLRNVFCEQVKSLDGWRFACVGSAQEAQALCARENANAVLLDESVAEDFEIRGGVSAFLLGNVPEGRDASLFTEILPKPLRMGYFVSRLKYHANLQQLPADAKITMGEWTFYPRGKKMVARGGDKTVSLTEKESALLEFLRQNGESCRDDILASVWGYAAGTDTHTLETHVSGLRKKLSADVIFVEQGKYSINSEWLGR